MKKVITFLVSATMVLLMFTGCQNNPSEELDETTATSFYKKLAGIDISNTTEPLVVLDSNGNKTTVPDSDLLSSRSVARSSTSSSGWHPLNADIVTFCPSSEIITFTNSTTGVKIIDDASGNYSETTTQMPGDGTQDDYFKKTIKGDFDGDKVDELIIYNYNKPNCRIFDDGDFSEIIEIPTSIRNYGQLLCASDMDNDGCDELIIVGSDNKSVLIYDIKNNKLSLKCTIKNSNWKYDTIEAICTGDFTNDGNNEVALIYYRNLYIFSLNNTTPTWIREGDTMLSDPPSAVASSIDNYFMGMGDFNGDGNKELCITSYFHTNDKGIIYTSTSKKITFDLPGYYNSTQIYQPEGLPFYIPKDCCIPVIADFDGNSSDDLIISDNVISFNSSFENSRKAFTISTYYMIGGTMTVSAGDINGDGKAEFCRFDSSNKINVYGMTDSGEIGLKKTFDTTGYYGFTMANIDNDSPIVQYIGHELKYTKPIVKYVIAGSPYYSELVGKYNYSPDGWSTTASRSTATSDGDSNSLGFSVGTKFGLESNLFFEESKMEVGIKASFNHEWNNSMSICQTVTFDTGGAGDDYVVFTTVPMDIFSYKVLQVAPIAPSDGYKVGDIATIEIPRVYGEYMVPLDYYNKNNGGFADINVFTHSIGNPSSYPTETEVTQIMAKYSNAPIYTFSTNEKSNWASYDVNWEAESLSDTKCSELSFKSGLQTLGKYNPDTEVSTNPTKTLGCSIDKTTGRAISVGGEYTVSNEVKAGIGVANATASVELGLAYDHTWTSDITHSIEFTGTVGNLPTTWADANSNKVYRAGVYGYPAQNIVQYDENGKAVQEVFWVIGYYVEY